MHRRTSRCSFLAAPLLAVVLLLPACSSDESSGEPVAPGFGPVEFHTGGGEGRDEDQERRVVDEDVAGWQEKWELAGRYAAGGYDEQALQVLDGALARSPPKRWAERLRALRVSLQVRRAEELLLRVEARGVKDYVPFETDVDFVIRLRNVSDQVVTLLAPPATNAASSPSALLLEITRLDRDVHATRLKRTWNQTVYIHRAGDPPIRIEPGAVHELPVRIPATAAGPAITGLRTLEVGGMLRPTRLRRGDERRRVRLPIRKGRVIALPQGFEPLAENPLGSMATAIDSVAPAHLLVATEFVPPSRRPEAARLLAQALATGHPALYRASLGGLGLLRERAVGTPLQPLAAPLMEFLESTPGRSHALIEGLSTLTGVRLAPDARLWKDWWRRETGNRTAVTAGEDA